MKFKSKPRVVEAIRITDESVGPVGSWLVLDKDKQVVVSNKVFINTYQPAGRGEAKAAHDAAKAELAAEAAEG